MGQLQKIRIQKMKSQNGRCYYCDLPMWDASQTPDKTGSRLLQCTAEHLQARCDGGKDTPDNIVAACRFCNAGRHARSHPMPPETYRHHVRKRMSQGKWLAHLAPAS